MSVLAHRIPTADQQIGHWIGTTEQPAAHAAVIERHLWHRALGLVTLDRPGEGAGKDQIAAVVLVVEDRATAFEGAGHRALVDQLVFKHEGCALGTAGGRFRFVDKIDKLTGNFLDRAVTLLRGALLGRDQAREW